MTEFQPFTASLTVEAYLQGVRIDSFLVRHFRNYTPYRMQRLVRAGQVRVEGIVAETHTRVYKGQQVSVCLLEPPDHLLPPDPRPLEVLFEDDWLIVVNKPADLVVHPCGNYASGSLANALQAHFDQQTERPGLVRPGIVHRLDRLTSGVIVCPKDHLAHRHLGISWEQGRVSKSYLALVHGEVEADKGDINVPIGQWPGGGTIRMSVSPDALEARPSRTLYEVVERFPGYTLVLARPLTGRLHQIRVHLASIGHPVLADEFYGPAATLHLSDLDWHPQRLASPFSGRGDQLPTTGAAKPQPTPSAQPLADPESGSVASPRRSERISASALSAADVGELAEEEEPGPRAIVDIDPLNPCLLNRQALHAFGLRFLHPITRIPLAFEAPLAADIAHVVERLRQRQAGPPST
ncbi:MAG: RluA family pseudouridine synthase [Planctomycetaceae bacterium]